MILSKAGIIISPDVTSQDHEIVAEAFRDLCRITRYLAVLLKTELEIKIEHNKLRRLEVITVESPTLSMYVERQTFLQAAYNLQTLIRERINDEVRKRSEQASGEESSPGIGW